VLHHATQFRSLKAAAPASSSTGVELHQAAHVANKMCRNPARGKQSDDRNSVCTSCTAGTGKAVAQLLLPAGHALASFSFNVLHPFPARGVNFNAFEALLLAAAAQHAQVEEPPMQQMPSAALTARYSPDGRG
jgi:hypothetical protein